MNEFHDEIRQDDIIIEDRSKYKPQDERMKINRKAIDNKNEREDNTPNANSEKNKKITNLEIEEKNNNDNTFPKIDVSSTDLKNAKQKFTVPSSLKKTFFCSLALFIVGITLIILGCIQDVANADPGKGITFWTIGSVILIPGGYYSYQFYKAKKARDLQTRNEILDQIPEM